MQYNQMVRLQSGQVCIFRNAEPADAEAYAAYYLRAHGETDFLTTYPDEKDMSPAKIADGLQRTKESPTDVEICAFVDGKLVGSAGNHMFRDRDKTRHRAEFGISVVRDYWGVGIGSLLTEASIFCARKAGFLQLELEVVADNQRAVGMYQHFGFMEYGRNPRGFRNRQGKWQELVLMRLELDTKL